MYGTWTDRLEVLKGNVARLVTIARDRVVVLVFYPLSNNIYISFSTAKL